MKWVFVLLLLVAGCTDPGQVFIAKGNSLASQKKFDQAVEAYRAAAQADPHQAHADELLGHVLFDQHRYDEARAAYQEALRRDPKALEAQIGLARLDADQGHLDEAIASLSKVIEGQPDNVYARLSRANLYVQKGEPEKAIEDTDAVRFAKSPSLFYTRGCALLAQKKFAEASQEFEQLKESPLRAYGEARLASAKGDKEHALSWIKEAREKSKGDWRPEEVKSDPAFRAFKNDPGFVAAVGG